MEFGYNLLILALCSINSNAVFPGEVDHKGEFLPWNNRKLATLENWGHMFMIEFSLKMTDFKFSNDWANLLHFTTG